MTKILWVGLAGFLGTAGRYLISGMIARRFGETFPLGTLAVNLMGCFLIGFLFHFLHERVLIDPLLRTMIMIGFLGAFTTFSSFGLQTFTLLREGQTALALLNILASNLTGLVLVWIGYIAARWIGGSDL